MTAGRSWKLPFALHWIWAELPDKLGRSEETLDRLYTLLDMCNTQHDMAISRQGVH